MNTRKKNKAVTIIDIAKELAVSKSTVSRALQDHHSIGPEMKQSVRALAEKYNYHPNTIASSLFKKSTKTIGVIVPILSHHFFSMAISGIEEVAYTSGYKVIICQSNDSYEREVSLVKALLSAQVDGLIISVSKETKKTGHFELFINNGIPVVFFDRLPKGIESNSVTVNDYKGAFQIVEHLILQGYKRIAHFSGFLNVSVSKNRLQGYKDALKKHKMEYDPKLVFEAGFERKHGMAAAEVLLAGPDLPDAVFAVSDPVAIGLMLTLKDRGIRIPEDIAVAGFNDDPVATIVDPPLTTVVQPAFEMGISAANIFLNKIAPGSDGSFIQKTHTTLLKLRGSTIRRS